jgi:hypothetical protein
MMISWPPFRYQYPFTFRSEGLQESSDFLTAAHEKQGEIVFDAAFTP